MSTRRTSTTSTTNTPPNAQGETWLPVGALAAERVTWLNYANAARRAQASLRIEDGREAGKAWRAWLDLSMSAEQRAYLNGGGCPNG